MHEAALILCIAALADIILGDPVYRLHPVRLMGRLITALENVLRRAGLSGLLGGVLLVLVSLSCVIGVYLAARTLLAEAQPWAAMVLDIFLVYSCLSLKDLLVHTKRVSCALGRRDLPGARAAVQYMVGRDAALLDNAGVARAAVESTAENFVDGLLSPVFWFGAGACLACAAGWPPATLAVVCLLGFKTVSTLDSMVGYRNARYLYFGRPSARLDDVLNFIPARLSIPVLCLAAALCGLDVRGCLRTALRDRCKHASPNAGHAESCMAGALGVRLGGPTRYAHGLVEKPWLEGGGADIGPASIDTACGLVLCAGLIILAGAAGVLYAVA